MYMKIKFDPFTPSKSSLIMIKSAVNHGVSNILLVSFIHWLDDPNFRNMGGGIRLFGNIIIKMPS